MIQFVFKNQTAIDKKQYRFLQLAAIFLFLFSVALTLAPAVRLHSWQVIYRWNHWIGFCVWSVSVVLIHFQLVRFAPERDPFIFPIISLLTGWGLLTIWRLDATMGARQTVWLLVCFFAISAGLRFRGILEWLRRYKYLILTIGLLLTGLTFLIGIYPGGEGPHLWLGCCGIYLQPSEPLKLLVILYLAAYLSDRIPITFNLAQLLVPTLIMIGSALALLIIQRDLGTASLFILIYAFVLYLASQRKWILLISLIALLAAGITGYMLFDVVRIRVDAWWNPWLDPSGRSYQIVQSLLAFASGGIFGRGPGLGSPGVVPVAHSDFIFASIAEESGLLGVSALLILYALLIGRGFRAALRAVNNYQRYLAAGIVSYLAIQGIFIMGGNLRLLPLTGVTLPFVSYGGSSLLTASISCLILIMISNHSEDDPIQLAHAVPYQTVSGGFLAGLLVLALAAGWWATIRSDALLVRTDNPRRGIADRYVLRGAILDRNNIPIVYSSGQPGNYQRLYDYPPLSTTTGYNNPLYGQAGLEAGLDSYLRGSEGNEETTVWFNHLVYGQPPTGLDIRLSINLEIQKKADDLLRGQNGALVLIDAGNGEILAIASHPYFDPNLMEAEWPALVQDPDAPLVNRASLGQYPPGASLGPFLMAFAQSQNQLDSISSSLLNTVLDQTETCVLEPKKPVVAASFVAAGCSEFTENLKNVIGGENLDTLYANLGFYTAPDLPLEITGNQTKRIIEGLPEVNVTPMQMAFAAAALTNLGNRPNPRLILSIFSPQEEWLDFQTRSGYPVFSNQDARFVVDALAHPNTNTWETISVVHTGTGAITWFISGSLPEFQPSPVALVVVLEDENANLAAQIGHTLLTSIQEPE